MKYNIYMKEKNNDYIFIHVKRKVGNSYKYNWICAEWLNDEDFKYRTKVSFNIFEAKKIIADNKSMDRQIYTTRINEYWIKPIME